MSSTLGFPSATRTGNTITIAPGTYGGVYMEDVTEKGITIDGSGAIFKGTILYYGEKFSGIEFKNFSFEDVKDSCFDFKNTGRDIFEGVTVKECLANRVGRFIQVGGTMQANENRAAADTITIARNKVEHTTNNDVVNLYKCNNVIVEANILSNIGTPSVDNTLHVGVIFLSWSNGVVQKNFIENGGGNGVRIFPMYSGLLSRIAQVLCKDNIIFNMRKYSAFEVNGSVVPKDYPSTVSIRNNNVGNLLPGNYVTGAVTLYQQGSVKTMIEDNLVYNTSTGKVVHLDGGAPFYEGGNKYFNTQKEAGVSPIVGLTLPTSPAYGKVGAFIELASGDKKIESITIKYTDGTYEIKP